PSQAYVLDEAREGFFMASITDSRVQGRTNFRQVTDAFLAQPGLPFAEVLPAERIEQVFGKHHNLFGMSDVYSTPIVLWAFLAQVLRDGKGAACQSAVAEIVAHQELAGLRAPTADTGNYCRARAKLSEEALHELTVEVAEEAERQAEPGWLWKGRHAKLVDGFTCTMPDTPANQQEYPQQSSQKPGVGFPIFRACVILSLATACVMELAFGRYSGKETGETALLRSLLDSLEAGDVLVADRFYCSFMMIALLLGHGCDVCARLHQQRRSDFRRGKRLGKCDHVIEWKRPPRPSWMDEATYASIPETLVLREVRFNVIEPGCRTRTLTIVTTLTDPKAYTAEDIAELYGYRWHSELDICAIKQSLHLDHAGCKSPRMIRREVWTTMLGYNLVRTTAAAAAVLHKLQPRQISFTGACQHVLSSWMILATGIVDRETALRLCRALLQRISQVVVANRPGRIEPRVLKRRRHRYPLMQEPRDILRSQLLECK
ncbi:MAG: IS4 family transposase, partial [Planctomycetia bacterium]|nr:IS4 family transposase [Planctomycetia bacterium]